MCRASCIHTGFGRIALLGLTYPEGIIWHAPILKPMHDVKIMVRHMQWQEFRAVTSTQATASTWVQWYETCSTTALQVDPKSTDACKYPGLYYIILVSIFSVL